MKRCTYKDNGIGFEIKNNENQKRIRNEKYRK
jgi:hypothetical protein